MRTRRWLGVLMAGMLAGVGCASPPAPTPDASMDAEPTDTAPRPDTGVCEDLDNDGHPSAACGGDDCDDNDPRRNPGVREVCDSNGVDEDCDPCTLSGGAADGDQDADGYERATCTNPWLGMSAPMGCNARLNVDAMTRTVRGTDCNDVPAMMGAQQSPGLPEVCNNMVDDNCNGTVDEAVMGMLYRDVDNDGRGDRSGAAGTTMAANVCSMMPGWVANNDDCDDTRQETYRGARELCDRRDNDCSLPGAMAGGVDVAEDNDDDGYAPLGAMCMGFGEAGAPPFAFAKTDCNDMAATVRPNATEICGNGIDEDCDRVVDNPMQRVCDDRDGDGHGDPSTLRTVMSCMVPAGTVTLCDDCDDNAATGAGRFPGNREACDRVDNDCSTPGTAIAVDEDTDNDGFAPSAATCVGRGEAGAPATAFPRTDCDDSVRTTYPGAAESCDRVDSDCSAGGLAAEEDADMDGYAPTAATCLARGEVGATSAALPRGDCDEVRASVNPGAIEDVSVCDGIDTDCNAATSELGRPCMGAGACSVGGVCSRGVVVVAMTAGWSHACARRNDGTVLCWGFNESGQIGDATMINRSAPTVVPALSNVVEVAAGGHHTCARRNDGTVLCWGRNDFGQLGDGTVANRSVPTLVRSLSNVVEISAGGYHTCARRNDGTVLCWGSNSHGQLGDGSFTTRTSPSLVPSTSSAVELSAGGYHTCARRGDGTVVCWGRGSFGQIGDGSNSTVGRVRPTPVPMLNNIVEVAAGGNFTCARRNDGTAACWGFNGEGELADNTTMNRLSPTAVVSLTDAAEISASWAHACARRSDGTVVCWGLNNEGQIGDGATVNRTSPAAVPGLTNVVEVAVGGYFTCARRSDSTVVCWGRNVEGQLGDGTTMNHATPTAVGLSNNVAEITAGHSHGCARRVDGSVVCWGRNDYGQLGDGTIVSRMLPSIVPGLSNVTAIAAGHSHTCARRSDGTVVCWGRNDYGQLGDGTMVNRLFPTAVPMMSYANGIALGQYHSCARLVRSTVCWGRNDYGQLGDGTVVNRTIPTTVPGFVNVTVITAGQYHSCARRLDLTLACSGRNNEGQLGDGTMMDRVLPVTVTLSGILRDVAAGWSHTCALLDNGVRCWGRNSEGQLGDRSFMSRASPAALPVLGNVAELALGENHTCARSTVGAVLCWGANNAGQLADNSTTNRAAPVAVASLSSVAEIAAGSSHTCARRNDATVLCWGLNSSGQLGDGTLTNRLTPVILPL